MSVSDASRSDASCRDDYDPASLSPGAALERILSSVGPIAEVDTVAVREALNRVLAENIRAGLNIPGHANSAMDGYAVGSADLPASGTARLRVTGTAWAGRPLPEAIRPGSCARIMTGAVMPEGTDTVIMQEDTVREDDTIVIDASTRPGENVRHAGEDIGLGATVLQRGKRLYPADIGLLASLGLGSVAVTRTPRVAFFSTGDELREIGETLQPGNIHDSNRYTLHGLLTRLNAAVTDLGSIRDDRAGIEQALLEAAGSHDLVITSGGVSVGEADFVREILDKVGNVDFWKVAMKPGRPLSFGRVGEAIFFGLPGNPVSTMVTFYQFVQPAVRAMMGEAWTEPVLFRARCTSRLRKRPGRVEYQRGILETGADGGLQVRTTGGQGSHILSSMSQANCFIVLGLDSSGAESGEMVDVQPFFGLA